MTPHRHFLDSVQNCVLLGGAVFTGVGVVLLGVARLSGYTIGTAEVLFVMGGAIATGLLGGFFWYFAFIVPMRAHIQQKPEGKK